MPDSGLQGDRNPESCAGFPLQWNTRGWFGALTLPRVIHVGNITHDSGMSDVFLRTPPLPELALLRETRGGGANTTVDVAPTPIPIPLSPSFRAQSFEVSANFTLPPASADTAGWDLGLQLLWNDHVEEFTRVGVRDGESCFWENGCKLEAYLCLLPQLSCVNTRGVE